MAPRFDSEDMLDAVLSAMTSGLNAKITAIEAEKIAASKGVTPTLAVIASDAYFLQTFSEKILNRSPAIFYGIEDVEPIDNDSDAAERYDVFCEVILSDDGQTNDTSKRIARYSRALKELFKDKFDAHPYMGKIKIKTVRPFSFRFEEDSSEAFQVGGVSLIITLA